MAQDPMHATELANSPIFFSSSTIEDNESKELLYIASQLTRRTHTDILDLTFDSTLPTHAAQNQILAGTLSVK